MVLEKIPRVENPTDMLTRVMLYDKLRLNTKGLSYKLQIEDDVVDGDEDCDYSLI